MLTRAATPWPHPQGSEVASLASALSGRSSRAEPLKTKTSSVASASLQPAPHGASTPAGLDARAAHDPQSPGLSSITPAPPPTSEAAASAPAAEPQQRRGSEGSAASLGHEALSLASKPSARSSGRLSRAASHKSAGGALSRKASAAPREPVLPEAPAQVEYEFIVETGSAGSQASRVLVTLVGQDGRSVEVPLSRMDETNFRMRFGRNAVRRSRARAVRPLARWRAWQEGRRAGLGVTLTPTASPCGRR